MSNYRGTRTTDEKIGATRTTILECQQPIYKLLLSTFCHYSWAILTKYK